MSNSHKQVATSLTLHPNAIFWDILLGRWYNELDRMCQITRRQGNEYRGKWRKSSTGSRRFKDAGAVRWGDGEYCHFAQIEISFPLMGFYLSRDFLSRVVVRGWGRGARIKPASIESYKTRSAGANGITRHRADQWD
ncbi:hypothetical protein J6590_044776 [Homalodisca vitripennis]|nr:hypothetical protein J6590_044776 [Homalodisca vitripennis]